jgi:DNA-directed RNA polymerase specialized sigma24 family protein
VTNDDELIESTETHVRIAAAQVARRFRGYITYADLAQEGILWVLRHPKTVANRLEDGRRGDYRLTAQLARYMEKKARAEKAATLRYDPADEAFYQRSFVETLLPGVWDSEFLIKPPDDLTASEPHARKADPAETSNWMVSVMDIREAWRRANLDENVRLALAYRYGDGLRISQIAELLEVADSTVQHYLTKGVNALIKQLGGAAPYSCNADCPDECGGPGTRRAISNAQARAITSGDYE